MNDNLLKLLIRVSEPNHNLSMILGKLFYSWAIKRKTLLIKNKHALSMIIFEIVLLSNSRTVSCFRSDKNENSNEITAFQTHIYEFSRKATLQRWSL